MSPRVPITARRAQAAMQSRRALIVGAAGVLAIAILLVTGDGRRPLLAGGLPPIGKGGGEPLTYSSDEDTELALRAAFGTSHTLFENSPDGVIASAERTEAYRPAIDA